MTSQSQFISIIIPVHNSHKTLGRCLESVFKSFYSNFECIVVDDQSTDNSLRVAESFDAKIIRLDSQQGAAYARNQGVKIALSDILLFVDADVEIYPDCLDKVVKAFEENPEISALFGSYDDQPGCSNFISQYKNLLHHYVHQTSREEASTFWTGCGAIKKDVFRKAGGFDQNLYSKPSIEDIELGYRLKYMGHRILLYKRLQVKHLKRWGFLSLLRADIFNRAIPWSRLILARRRMIADLNLQISDRISAGLVCLAVGIAPFSLLKPQVLYAILGFLGIVFALNYKLFRFFFKRKGWKFVALAFMMYLLYYFYSTLTFALCWSMNLFGGKKVA